MADYYKAHKAEKKSYYQDYYADNKEIINERNKEWYEKHKNQPTKRIYYRQKDILKILSAQRKQIGDASYYLLVEEINKLNKEVFKV